MADLDTVSIAQKNARRRTMTPNGDDGFWHGNFEMNTVEVSEEQWLDMCDEADQMLDEIREERAANAALSEKIAACQVLFEVTPPWRT